MDESVAGYSSWPLFGYSTRFRLGLSKLASSDEGRTERHMFNNCSTVRRRLVEPFGEAIYSAGRCPFSVQEQPRLCLRFA